MLCGPKGKVIGFLWSQIKGQGHSDLLSTLFGHNSTIHTLIMTTFQTNVYKKSKVTFTSAKTTSTFAGASLWWHP